MRLGVEEGGWVVLQNLHHALEWLPSLANTISRLYNPPSSSSTSTTAAATHTRQAAATTPTATTLHPSFRLILTTKPTGKVNLSKLLLFSHKQINLLLLHVMKHYIKHQQLILHLTAIILYLYSVGCSQMCSEIK